MGVTDLGLKQAEHIDKLEKVIDAVVDIRSLLSTHENAMLVEITEVRSKQTEHTRQFEKVLESSLNFNSSLPPHENALLMRETDLHSCVVTGIEAIGTKQAEQ